MLIRCGQIEMPMLWSISSKIPAHKLQVGRFAFYWGVSSLWSSNIQAGSVEGYRSGCPSWQFSSLHIHTHLMYIQMCPSDELHASYWQMTIKTKFKTHKNIKTHFMASSLSFLWHLFRPTNRKCQNWLIPSQRKTQDCISVLGWGSFCGC